ncbi:MAG: fumarylacetoacetate hydrolase family protein [Pseudomonadota bacterium]|nr:fumarylacetoacetate hydrolase family protein [Pseudomonadota bacterium]
MKLVSFVLDGRATFGAISSPANDGIVDLGAALAPRFSDLKSLLADPQGLAAAKTAVTQSRSVVPFSSVTLLPVIPNPGAIWCIGLNYREHVAETSNKVGEQPVFFQRTAMSQAAHHQPIPCPPESEKIDYEGEIALVIGTGGRRIAEVDAWAHVAGYACYNDVSVRDWQRHSPQWGPGKNFWRTGAFGPWLVTADEIEAGASLTLVTRVNGRELQRATTDMMIHSIPKQIAYLSTIAPLAPGDVLVTGTPGGVGAARTPQVWLRPGDRVQIEVSRVGLLENTMIEEVDAR